MNASVETSLSQKSTVTVGLMIVLIGSIAGYILRQEGRMNSLEISVNERMSAIESNFNDRMSSIEMSVNKIADKLEMYLDDSWTLTMQSELSLRRKIANPGIDEPDPRRPGYYIRSSPDPP
ncbi:MAG: hypothetical protein ACIAQF_11065 [Phycisphaerales bacterium JB065]